MPAAKSTAALTFRDALLTAIRTCQGCGAVVAEDERKCSCGTSLKPRRARDLIADAVALRGSKAKTPRATAATQLLTLVRKGEVVKTAPATYALPKPSSRKKKAAS